MLNLHLHLDLIIESEYVILPLAPHFATTTFTLPKAFMIEIWFCHCCPLLMTWTSERLSLRHRHRCSRSWSLLATSRWWWCEDWFENDGIRSGCQNDHRYHCLSSKVTLAPSAVAKYRGNRADDFQPFPATSIFKTETASGREHSWVNDEVDVATTIIATGTTITTIKKCIRAVVAGWCPCSTADYNSRSRKCCSDENGGGSDIKERRAGSS